MRRVISVLFALAVAMALPQSALAKAPEMPIAYSVQLVVNESLPGFTFPKPTIVVPRGIVKFTAIVPSSAKESHGIGIDGGRYKNILGAPVKPGRTTSLTISLSPGDYTVFDSYKKNRAKGYALKVHVTHAKQKHVSYGKLCAPTDFFGLFQVLWTKNVSCRSAWKLSEAVGEMWADSNYSYEPIVEREFTCFITPASAIGLKTSCLAGDSRVTWSG
jgi:hypothetical protein